MHEGFTDTDSSIQGLMSALVDMHYTCTCTFVWVLSPVVVDAGIGLALEHII